MQQKKSEPGPKSILKSPGLGQSQEKTKTERRFVLPRRLNPKSWNFVIKQDVD